MSDVKLLGTVAAGTQVQVNGKQLIVSHISADRHGCEQWTLTYPQSDCQKYYQKEHNND